MTFYNLSKFVINILFSIIFNKKVYGLDNLPSKGRVIICCNHSSVYDPIFLGISLNRKVHFMAKKELFKNKFFGLILKKLGSFPINRNGQDLSAIKNALRILKKEEVLGLFPEGTRVQKIDVNKVKSGVAMISIKAKAPIVPVYIDSSYKLFSKVDIHVGKPIEFKEYYNKRISNKEYKNISIKTMKEVYSLRKFN